MSLLLALALLLAPAQAADEPMDPWAEVLQTTSPDALRLLAENPEVPPDIRVRAALALVDRVGASPAELPASDEPSTEAEPRVEEQAADGAEPRGAALPAGREDLACDEEGKVVRVIPYHELATLTSLDVQVHGDRIDVHGVLDKAAGRPLHYLIEGGSADYPSRYVVSMVGVKSGLEHAEVPVASKFVDNVRVVERDGAIIVVVNSHQERRLRVDFHQSGDRFTITLRTPPPSVG